MDLLGPPVRECPHGHGSMDRQQGAYALNQVSLAFSNGGKTAAFDTGVRYVAALYRCPKCGLLELVDEAH